MYVATFLLTVAGLAYQVTTVMRLCDKEDLIRLASLLQQNIF